MHVSDGKQTPNLCMTSSTHLVLLGEGASAAWRSEHIFEDEDIFDATSYNSRQDFADDFADVQWDLERLVGEESGDVGFQLRT